MTLNLVDAAGAAQRSFKVIHFGANRKPVYDHCIRPRVRSSLDLGRHLERKWISGRGYESIDPVCLMTNELHALPIVTR